MRLMGKSAPAQGNLGNMTIEGLVVEEAMAHLRMHGWVKHMDPMALHILKTSENPSVAAMRHWMRQTALRQAQEAQKQQVKLNAQVAAMPRTKGVSIRLAASLAPYYAEQMQKMHKANWGDPEFLGSVKEGNPQIFPKRDA